MPTMLAALGLSQLKKVDYIIKERRERAKYLNKKLAKIKEINIFEEPNKNYFAVYQMYTIRILEGAKIRNELMAYLQNKGISAKIYFEPVHQHTIFKDLGYTTPLPQTEKIANQVLSLPIYPTISYKELDYIIKNIFDFFKRK